MLYVPYSTKLCRKLQARTKEIIKNAKINPPQRKWHKVPVFHALNMPRASQQRASSPQQVQSEQKARKLQKALIFEGQLAITR